LVLEDFTMAKFVKLTDFDNEPVYVNLELVLRMNRYGDGTTTLDFDGVHKTMVKEHPEEILAM
jgi:hypothetical protein